jgi:chromosomal replication initiator protein
VLGELQLQLPRPSFETWLKQTEGLHYDHQRFVVAVPTPFAVAWLERRMYQVIQSTVEKVTRRPLELQFLVKSSEAVSGSPSVIPTKDPPSATEADPMSTSPWNQPRWPSGSPSFNPKYTFGSFVVGPSNRMAYSASHAMADTPGRGYNPLFLYSGVGLGKTHLLHAIGQACLGQGMSVLYASSEQFTNEFILAIRNRTTEQFHQRYRTAQVLLIDDVQFISGKEQTQEGFFHTFNHLHNSGRQIVITSDRPPRALALLEDRLRSRFEWGLIADIQPPDLETRMAILTAKAEQLHVSVGETVIELIAKRVQRNIRDLEGTLNRVVASHQLMNTPLNLESTSRILDDLVADSTRHAVDPERIVEEVSRHYKIPIAQLIGPGRTKRIALARQVAMYLLMYEITMSPTKVGRLLGNRHHATVIHGAGKVHGEINEDHHLRQDVLTIKEAIFSPRAGSQAAGEYRS